MDINEILNSLGVDLANPEARRGAIEAIQAILASRTPPPSMSGGAGGVTPPEKEIDVEIDPDLLQPSQKFNQSNDDLDIEIEDEEDILSQIKRNEADDDFDNGGNSSGNDSSGSESGDSSSSEDSSDSSDSESEGTDDVGNSNDTDESEMSDEAEDATANMNNDDDSEASSSSSEDTDRKSVV